MAKVALIALALAGCNQVYGLDQTKLVDAVGPVRCTDEAPRFRGMPVLVVPGKDGGPGSIELSFYNISPDRTLAVAAGNNTLYEGPGDSAALGGANLNPPPPSNLRSPRLAPERDELFVSYTSKIDRYARDAGEWILQATVLSLSNYAMSAPTERVHGPRHMLVLTSTMEFREYVETSPDQWQPQGAGYPITDFGVTAFTEVNMTPDGLHVVVSSVGVIGYASRARLEDRFTKPVTFNPFFGGPTLFDTQITANCGRLYFILLGMPAPGVYYVDAE